MNPKHLLLFVGAVMGGAYQECVPDWTAKELVQTFQKFFTDGNVAKIKATLTPDFTIYSDSQEFTSPGVTPVSRNPIAE